jgi:16S rRNA (cytidine1402-2'-O)-methyltransferase
MDGTFLYMETEDTSQGRLSIVATPIGNLEDMTFRAVRVLGEADYVLCEDTRVTGKLLKHYGIVAKMKRYDAHTSEQMHLDIIDDIKNGMHVAMVSDAGTPGVSDPGVLLVQKVRAETGRHRMSASLGEDEGELGGSITIDAIPGPSAVTAAFSIAGLAGNQFTFLGFVPHKKGRQTFFKSLAEYDHPVIFFESTHRILKTLESLESEYGANSAMHRTITIGRELTKMHEEMLVGSAQEILDILIGEPVRQKGEFVVIVS